VGRAVNEFGANQTGNLLFQVLRHQNTPTQPAVTRIRKGDVRPSSRLAFPGGEHTEGLGEILDSYLCPQLVEAQLVRERSSQGVRAVKQEAAAMCGRCFCDQEIDDDLPLWCQQCTEPALSRPELSSIGRDQAVEKAARLLARDLDHAPVGKKRCFHLKFLLKFWLKRK